MRWFVKTSNVQREDVFEGGWFIRVFLRTEGACCHLSLSPKTHGPSSPVNYPKKDKKGTDECDSGAR